MLRPPKMERTRINEKQAAFLDKIVRICREHGGLVERGGYVMVDKRKYEVREL
jgi:hypothetical protein